MLVLALGAKDAEDTVKRPDTVAAPVAGPTLAAELDAGVEVVVVELAPTPVVLAPDDTDARRPSVVASASRLFVALVLVMLPPPSASALTAALYALSAAPSALPTAASDILYGVPPHAACTACNGVVRNSG